MTIETDNLESYSYMLLDAIKDHIESNADFYGENPDSLEGLEIAQQTVFGTVEAIPELLKALKLCHEQLSLWVADEDQQSPEDKEALDAAAAVLFA